MLDASNEFSAGAYGEFSVGVTEMELDRLGAEEERRSGFFRRCALRDDQRDLKLLRCQVAQRWVETRSDSEAGCPQFLSGFLCPWLGAKRFESRQRRTKAGTRVRPAARAPAAPPEAELRPGPFPRRGVAVKGQRLGKRRLVGGLVVDQAAAARGGRRGPTYTCQAGLLLEQLEFAGRVVESAEPDCSFDQVGPQRNDHGKSNTDFQLQARSLDRMGVRLFKVPEGELE